MIAEATWSAKRVIRSSRRALLDLPERLRAWRRYWQRYSRYNALSPAGGGAKIADLYPSLGDDRGTTPVEPVYYFQDWWAFKRISASRPRFHVDIASHHRFVSLLSVVLPMVTIDIRPTDCLVESLRFVEGSISQLPLRDSSVTSLSCLCVLEHIGLGRYGDAVDPNGTRRAMSELVRVTAPGADVYVSVPVGPRSTIRFDAHRVFADEDFLALCAPLELVEVSYINGSRLETRRTGDESTACYHLRRPDRTG